MVIEKEIKIGYTTPAGVVCGSFKSYFYKHINPLGLE